MKHASPRIKIFALIGTIISTIAIALVIVFSVYGFNNRSKDDFAISDTKVKGVIDLDNKIPESNLLFDYDSVNGTATFKGLASFDKTAYKTLEIPSTVMYDDGNGEKPYTVTAVKNIVYTQNEYAPHGYTQTHDANGNPKTTYYSSIFYYGSFLTALVIPDTVTEIEEGAFYGLASIEYLKTPFVGTGIASKKPIGAMFSVGYYNEVTDANYIYPFMCANDGINASTANHVNVTYEMNWYEKTMSSTYFYHIPVNLKTVVITKETSIGTRAFVAIPSIEQIVLPDTLTSVGDYAFSELSSLTSINLPNSLTSISVGLMAECTSIETIILPNNVTGIPNNAFGGCSSLELLYIPSSITKIGDEAFEKCTDLADIKVFYNGQSATNIVPSSDNISFPSGLSEVGKYAFKNCESITLLRLSNNVTSIGEGAFGGMSNLAKLYIPFVGKEQGNDGYQATIGYLFGEVDNGDTYQATQCNSPCRIPSSLREIQVTNETIISTDAFKGLSNQANIAKGVTTIVINSGVTYIENKAFDGCASLVSITLPFTGVYTRGSISGTNNNKDNRYFSYIFGKTPMNGLEIDDENDGTGRYIPVSLRNITITNQPIFYTGTFTCLKYITSVEIYPNATTEIGEALFYKNDALQSLTLPFVGWIRGDWYRSYTWWYTLTRRNQFSWVFSEKEHGNTYADNTIRYYNSYIRYIPNQLTHITVTDEDYIGPYSFKNLTSVTHLTIGNINNKSGLTIAKGSCSGMNSLTNLTVPFIGQAYNSGGDAGASHSLGWIFGNDGNDTYHYKAYEYETFYVPRTLSKVNVETISKVPNYSLANLTSVSTIEFNSVVTEVGSYSFYNDTSLSKIDYKAGSDFTKVGDYAFYNNVKLNYLKDAVPLYSSDSPATNQSVYGLVFGASAFGKTAISSIDFTKIKKAGEACFEGCFKLFSIEVTSNVEVANYLFRNCIYLTSINLAPGKATVGMFEGCTALVNADVAAGTTYEDLQENITKYYIPDRLFKGCSQLIWGGIGSSSNGGLIINSQITTIGESAFEGCTRLTTFTIPDKVVEIKDRALYGVNKINIILIPTSVQKIGANVFTQDIGHDFGIWVHEPKEKWPKGWTTGWNCVNPVYVIPGIDDSMYEFEFSSELLGYVITGIKSALQGTLTGRVNLPRLHNYVDVVGVDKDVFKYENVDQIVVPSSIKYFGDNALSSGKRTDVYFELLNKNKGNLYYIEKDPSQNNIYVKQKTNNVDKKVTSDWKNLIPVGYVFFGDYWQYGSGEADEANTPYLKASELYFEIESEFTYNAQAWTPEVSYIETKAEVVRNKNIEDLTNELDADLFNYVYKNNVYAGTATVYATINNINYNQYILEDKSFRIAGSAEFNFEILQAPIKIWYTNTKEDHIFEASKTYDEKTYSESNFGNHNVVDLLENCVFTGRIETTSADAGTYEIDGLPSNEDFIWAQAYKVTRKGQDVTRNFIPLVYMRVVINPLVVNLDWTDCNKVKDQYDILDYLEYQYTGQVLVPTAAAFKLDGTPVPHCIVETFEYNTLAKYPDTDPSLPISKYDAKARIAESSRNNYVINNPVSLENQYIEAKYTIVKREVTICLNDSHYLIPYNDKSFIWNNWDWNNPEGSTLSLSIEGLQNGSKLVGTVVTVANEYHIGDHDSDPSTPDAPMANKKDTYTTENGSVDWKDTTVVLANYLGENDDSNKSYENSTQPVLPWFIYNYVNGKIDIENKYYNVTLDSSITIAYNEFIIDYVVDGEVLTLGNKITIDGNDQYPAEYEADGNVHQVYPVIKNEGIAEGDYKVNYGVGTFTNDIPTVQELGFYTIGINVSRKNFEQEYKIIRLECIKSNVKYDLSILNKEYDGEPVPTFDKYGMSGNVKFITKKALDTDLTEGYEDDSLNGLKQEFTFEYCDLNKNVISAPTIPGTYYIHIQAPQTHYFNAINKYQVFTISKRVIDIYVDHVDLLDPTSDLREPIVYDGSPITFTIDTTAGGARGKLLGEAMDINGLDTRHQLKGTFVTRSQYPGTYSAENEDDFIWTTNWNVYSLQLGNIRTYYDVKLHGSVKIAQKTIKYTVSEPYNGPFDGIPHGLTITVEDPNPAQASVLFTTVEANATNDGPNSDIEWSPVCPKYTEPGSYQIWFKIVAGLIPNTDGETTYKTEYGTKTINITALVFEYTKPTELVVDQSTNPETPYYIEYDGEEHELEIIVTNHPTPIIHYRLYKGTDLIYDGYNVPKVVEKGTYTLTAKIEADFYQTIEFEELEYQFRVTDEYLEELPSVVCQDVIETFTGNAYSIEVIVSGLANDKVVNIKYEADNSGSWSVQNPTFTNVGSHTIRYLVHVKGYQVKVGEAQVIITPASFTGLITAQGYNGPYTATAHKPVITGIPLNATNAVIYYTDNHDVTYLPLTANGWFTDVDQFAYTNAMNAKTIYFTITTDNYEDYTDSVDIKIDKVQLAPTFTNGKEIEYSGKPLTVSQLEIDTIHDGYPNIKYYNATVDGSNNYTYLETDLISAPTQLGTYYFKLEYADTDNCYPAQVEGGFKIVPRTVTVNYTQEVEYNGKERGPNPTVITGTDDVLYIVATRKDGITSLPIEIGEYDFTFAFSTNQVNYKLPDNCKEITFKITQIHLLVEFTDQKDYKDDEVWTRTSNWNEFSFTNKLLKDHEFHSVMETSNYAHGTYVYSTDNQTVSSYVVNIYNTYITDADGNDVTNLYDIKYDIVVKIVYPPISFNLIEYDEPYDGYAHGLEFSFGPNIDTTKITIYYCEEENYDAEDPAWSQTKPTRTGVGSDKIYFRMISSIYETVEGYGIVKVTPAYLDINIFDYSEVYDAADHYVSFEVTNVYGIDNSIAIKDYYPVEYVDFEELTDLYQDFNEDNPYYSLYEDYRLAAMKDAGHYYAVVRFEEAQNWIESYAIKEVEVQQRGIHFDLLSSKPMIETNYNGTKYGQNKPYILIGDALYNPSELIPTHNMLYATKYGSTQYNLANKNYSVRTVSANAGYYYGTYYVDMFGNTYNTHGFEFNNMKILDANKKDVTKNYYPIFDDNDLIVKINRIALPKFDVTSPDSKEYDGQAPTPTVDTPSDGVITYKYYEYINGVFINTELDSVNATEVGKYKVYVSIANGTNYYAWPTEEISEYEILPRNVDVIWEDEEVTFNGQKQEPKAYFINAFNEKQYVDVYMFNVDNYYEQILKAGSYEAYVKDDPTLYNYKLNNTNVLFVINKYQQDIVVDGDTNVTDSLWTYYFDENDITTLSDLSITNSAQNGKASISTISSAGGYYEGNDKFTKDVCVLTSTNEDVTDSILFNIIGTVRIITHEITYSIDDEIKIKFDNHYHSVDTYLNVTNPRKSDAVITYSWTSDYHGSSEDNDSSFIDTYGKPQFKDVDTYYVTFNIHCDGYDDDVQGTTTIVIYNKDSFINYTGEKSITYSGNEITKTYLLQYLTGEWNYESDKDELVITFFEYGQTEPMENNPIDAGVYEVVITVKDDDVSLGYTILNESFVIEITPRILALNIKPSILITNEDETLDDLNWTYNNGTFDETNGILDITGVDVTNVTYEVENAATDVLLFEIDGSNSYLNRGVHNITNLALSSVEVFDGSNYSYNTSTTLEFDQYGLEALGFVWNVRSATKKDTDTGKYIDVTKNYGINLTITVNIHLPYLKVNIPDKTFDYNGQPHSTTIEIVEPANADLSLVKEYYAASQTDLSIKYAGGDSNATSISTVQFTNPGTWPTYYLIDYPNYEPATGSFNIKINKDVRNIVFNDQSLHKTYDGKPAGTKNVNTPYYLPTYTYDSSTTATGLPDFTNFADNIQVTYRKENASLWTSEAIDQGNYQYKVIIPESDNYQETEYIGSFTIDRRPIYISGLYQTGYTGSHVYYNNFASTNSYYHFYMQDLDTNVMKDITISKYKIVATITPNSIAQGQYDGNEIEFYATNGNSYYVYYDNVDVTRNYELAFEGHPEVNPATFIIQPGDMTVNIDNTIATYDGSKHHFDVHVTFPENNVNTTISYSEDNINWSTNIPEYTERGERIIHVKITDVIIKVFHFLMHMAFMMEVEYRHHRTCVK